MIDISQEVFSCCVYPGDPSPKKDPLIRIEQGEKYNLTAFSMCCHNGTHVDAPYHFIPGGKTIEEISMEHFVGECFVARPFKDRFTGDIFPETTEKENAVNGKWHELTGEMAKDILAQAKEAGAPKRILLAGNVIVTVDAAKVFAEGGILLLGVESQSVGPVDAPMAVHLALLAKEVVLLEGIRLSDLAEGQYYLCAAPLNLAGCDGAPCRAVLI